MGNIIEIVTRNGEKHEFEVIEDIAGPEEISIGSIELFFPRFSGRSVDRFHAADIRDHLEKADRSFGLQHAVGILKRHWEIPESWKVYELFFPGTIMCAAHNNRYLYLPFMAWGYRGWVIHPYPFWRTTWFQDAHRFIRWRI